jgi:hypothetical protein
MHTAFKLDILQAPREKFGLNKPLQDLEILNVVAIARNITFHDSKFMQHLAMTDRMDLLPMAQKKCAKEWIKNYLPDWSHYHEYQDLKNSILQKDKFEQFLFNKIRNRNLGSKKKAKLILTNYQNISKKAPDYLLYNQIKLTYNALPTLHRLSKVVKEGLPGKACFFCKSIEPVDETIEHLFGGSIRRPMCPIVDYLRQEIATHTNNLYFTNLAFKDQLLMKKMSVQQTNAITTLNLAIWLTRRWLKTMVTTPRITQRKSVILARFKETRNLL